MRLYKFLTILLLFCSLSAEAAYVNLAWDASTSPTAGGYKVSYGTSAGNYTTTVDVGNTTSYLLSGLTAGTKYYFAAKTYNTDKTAESTYSNEVSYTPATAPNPPTPVWSPTDVPASVMGEDSPVELGVQFTVAKKGLISSIRWYKGVGSTGTHNVNLWDQNGILIASAVTQNETTDGWQEAVFTVPVIVDTGNTYTASYHSNNGFYGHDKEYFTNPLTVGQVTLLAGVFAYGADSVAPTNTYQNTNYWVDVVYQEAPAVVPLLPPSNFRVN